MFFNFDIYIVIPILLLQFFLNYFFSIFLNKKSFKKFHSIYSGEQKIHKGFIPRTGGIAMFLSLFLMAVFNFNLEGATLLIKIIICMIPLLFITLLEDFFNNIKPNFRLSIIFITSLLFFLNINFELPYIDIPFFSEFFLNNEWVLIFLLIFSLTVITNAFNIIDGLNGLLLFNFISISLSILMMSIFVNDLEFTNIMSLIITISFIQLFFNFPIAKVFAGDFGAYSFGIILGFLIIIFFGRYQEFLTWQAIFVLIYPAFEMLVTIFRRLFLGSGLMIADRYHLHHLFFIFFKNKNFSDSKSNSFSTLILFPLYFFPLTWVLFHGTLLNLNEILIGFLVFISLYLFLYYFIYRITINN